MKSLQGPMDPCFHPGLEFLEGGNGEDFSSESGSFEDAFSHFSFPENVPFLQMLGVEPPSVPPLAEPNFQLLLRLQEQKQPWKPTQFLEPDARVPALELESCITNVSESQSPVKSETKELQYPLCTSSYPEAASSGCCNNNNNPEPNSPEICKRGSSMWAVQFNKPVAREKKKRKRTRPCKNSEEVESQRMTHIAVERNRRKQMNDHLNALRSLMPSSFIQRGDQASIVGGAIDFVKELEQLLQTLQAQKRLREADREGGSPDCTPPFNGFFTSPQYRTFSASQRPDIKHLAESYEAAAEGGGGEFTAENKSAAADIEVTVIQTHVNVKVLSPRRPGQLLRAITALEELFLTILHLNVTSLDQSALYSFNLKIEEECKLASADEIAAAVYQIFSYINSS